jgi:hypothetical protein
MNSACFNLNGGGETTFNSDALVLNAYCFALTTCALNDKNSE